MVPPNSGSTFTAPPSSRARPQYPCSNPPGCIHDELPREKQHVKNFELLGDFELIGEALLFSG